jgi:serine/threonine protein kinase
MIIDKRFKIIKLLGQGSFSTIYSAIDLKSNQKIVLKVEKPDKSKRILIFEYDSLQQLQGLPNICEVFEFVERNGAGLES